MSKREDCSNVRRAHSVMLGIILAGSTMPIAATAGTVFTWDPSGASPSLSGRRSRRTRSGDHYLYRSARWLTLARALHGDFIEPITGFTLGGTRSPRRGLMARRAPQLLRPVCGYAPAHV